MLQYTINYGTIRAELDIRRTFNLRAVGAQRMGYHKIEQRSDLPTGASLQGVSKQPEKLQNILSKVPRVEKFTTDIN